MESISIAKFIRKPSRYIMSGLPFGITKRGTRVACVVSPKIKWYVCEHCGDNTANILKFRSKYKGKERWEKLKLCDECGAFLVRRGVKKPDFRPGIKNKLDRYKDSKISAYEYDRQVVLAECSRLQKKLKIKSVERREYILLKSLRETLESGGRVDVVNMAIRAGYPARKTRQLGSSVMKTIPDKLFDEIIGVSRRDIKLELSKVMKQDEDLAAKNRALELASKITGLSEPEGTVKLQINQAFEVAD